MKKQREIKFLEFLKKVGEKDNLKLSKKQLNYILK